MSLIDYVKAMALSVYPLSYHEFREKTFGQVMGYFLFVLLVGMLLCNLLLIPFYADLPDVFAQSLGKFEKFDVSNDVEMSSPIEIPKQEAFFVVDTTGTIKEIQHERIIITDEYVYYKPFFKNKRVALDTLIDLDKDPNTSAWLIIGLLLVLAPSIFFYGYLMLFVKYFILIFFSSFIIYFVVRVLMLYEISLKNTFACAFYAGTLMIILESLIYPINNLLLVPVFDVLGMHFYVVSYVLFLVFGVLGMVIVEKDLHLPKKHKKKEHKHD